MSLSRPGETEPIHSVSYGHVAACQLMGPHTLALRVGESQLLLQSPQVSGKRSVEGGRKGKAGKKHLLSTEHDQVQLALGTGDGTVMLDEPEELNATKGSAV